MAADWQDKTWGEIATLEYGKSLRNYVGSSGKFPVFGTNGQIGWHTKALYEEPSVIVGRKGAYRGIHYSTTPFFVIDTAFYLKPKINLDTKWAYYELLTHDINAMDSGSAIPSTSRDEFYSLDVLVPPLSEQRRIAHILGTLDDRIENNRKTAKTLEAMAQAIFQSWFVDFDPVRAKMVGESKESICKRLKLTPEILDLFPDRLVDSELGEIPDGWGVKPIVDEFDITMGQSPPGNTYNQIGDGLPFYQGCADFGIKYPANRVFCTEPTRTARKGDALISVRAPVGRMNVATETCAIGRGVAAIQHHTESTAYTYNMIKSLHDIFDGFNSEGTVFGAIGKSDFHKIKIISPQDIVVTKYDSICNAIDQLQTIFHEETTRLGKVRDTLLPKLISGEIRVPDLDFIAGGSIRELHRDDLSKGTA